MPKQAKQQTAHQASSQDVEAKNPKLERACLPRCTGDTVGLLQFRTLQIRKSKQPGEVLVRFQLVVPCTLSSEFPTLVTFMALSTNPSQLKLISAEDVIVRGNVICGKARLVAKQTYQVNSFTSNPREPLRFTAGTANRLLAFDAPSKAKQSE